MAVRYFIVTCNDTVLVRSRKIDKQGGDVKERPGSNRRAEELAGHVDKGRARGFQKQREMSSSCRGSGRVTAWLGLASKDQAKRGKAEMV